MAYILNMTVKGQNGKAVGKRFTAYVEDLQNEEIFSLELSFQKTDQKPEALYTEETTTSNAECIELMLT